MEYVSEVLDRLSGDLAVVSIGDYVTITEFCESKGAGSRQGRAVLAEMGLLAEETDGKTTRWRLIREAVSLGLGKRHDRPKKGKYPFDVLSPKGQEWASARWAQALAETKAGSQSDPVLRQAVAALEAFKAPRSVLPVQMEVCWLMDHFPTLGVMDISRITGVPKQSVSRFIAMRADKRRAALARRQAIQRTIMPGSLGSGYWLGVSPPSVGPANHRPSEAHDRTKETSQETAPSFVRG